MPRSIPPAGGPHAYLDAPPQRGACARIRGEGPLDASGVPPDTRAEPRLRHPGVGHAHWLQGVRAERRSG
eukprot:2032954-Alexandrium_andersonii.AAC.1